MTFDYYDSWNEGIAAVYDKNKGYNLIDKQGNLLSPNMWFDSIIDYFENEIDVIHIQVNNKEYKINKKGMIQNLS